MICPVCHGKGEIMRLYFLDYRETAVARAVDNAELGWSVEPCPHPGCHNGRIPCCEPDNDGLPKGIPPTE